MDWIYHDFYMEYGLIWSELKIENGVTYQDMANSLNWSGFLHGKCFLIVQDCCMANGLNWSNLLQDKCFELITILKCEIVWIDLIFFMENGLNWSGGLHGKWSGLIMFFTWKIVCIDQDVYIANGLNF